MQAALKRGGEVEEQWRIVGRRMGRGWEQAIYPSLNYTAMAVPLHFRWGQMPPPPPPPRNYATDYE